LPACSLAPAPSSNPSAGWDDDAGGGIGVVGVTLAWWTRQRTGDIPGGLDRLARHVHQHGAGVLAIDPKLLEMGRVYHFPRRLLLTEVYLPGIASPVMAGLTLATGVA